MRKYLLVFASLLVVIAIIALSACGSDYIWFTGNGSVSMYPTFWAAPGQRVYFRRTQDISRGDIVVYRHFDSNHMKRVIALGGDTIEFKLCLESELDFDIFWIYLNGQFLDESEYLAPFGEHEHGSSWTGIGFWLYDGFIVSESRDHFFLAVPNGYFFTMGDNRDGSLDGRNYGPVSMDNLIGVFAGR